MSNSSPIEVFASLRDTDPDVLDAEQLDTFLGLIAQHRAWCDALQVRATRRQKQLAADGRATEPRNSLANHGRQSGKEAKAAAEREEVCNVMPGFEDALSDGSVSSGHLDAIAKATNDLDDAERAEFVDQADNLLDDARGQSVDAFTKGCRDLAKNIRARHNANSDVEELEKQKQQSRIRRWRDPRTGMCHTHIEADPVTDRLIWAAIQKALVKLRRRNQKTGQTGTTSWDRLQVDALVEALTSNGDSKDRPAMVVHIDLDTLVNGRHDNTLCETDSGIDIPIETARRVACDAEIIPVVLDGNGVVLDEGRAKRLATFEQRVAIQAMQSSCSHPDCTVTVDECPIHHLDPWKPDGRTDLAKLAPVRESHHHLVHEGGWTLTMTPDRIATWTRPDGTIYWIGPLTDRRAA